MLLFFVFWSGPNELNYRCENSLIYMKIEELGQLSWQLKLQIQKDSQLLKVFFRYKADLKKEIKIQQN